MLFLVRVLSRVIQKANQGSLYWYDLITRFWWAAKNNSNPLDCFGNLWDLPNWTHSEVSQTWLWELCYLWLREAAMEGTSAHFYDNFSQFLT